MPIYEYQCGKCGHEDDFLEKIGAPSVRKCPSCGKRSFQRLVSRSAFHLKGDGWYVTDFRDKGKAKAKDKDADTKANGSEETKPKKEEKASAKGAEAGKDKGGTQAATAA